jgi:hypothetical protein
VPRFGLGHVVEIISRFVEAILDVASQVIGGVHDGAYRVIEDFAEDVAGLNDAIGELLARIRNRMHEAVTSGAKRDVLVIASI